MLSRSTHLSHLYLYIFYFRQYLLDAVAYCGTSTCISMVHDVILTGQVTGERMNMFLQSIALVGKTTLTMIKDVLAITRKQPSRQAFLTLGTLMSRHCTKSPKDCESVSKLSSFIKTSA